MPLNVKCSCGRQLSVPDSARGKKGKCPACGKIVAIPKAAPAEQATLTVSCACGKVLRVPARLAGKSGKCPACWAPVQIPERPGDSGDGESVAAEAAPEPSSRTEAPPEAETGPQSEPSSTATPESTPESPPSVEKSAKPQPKQKQKELQCPTCGATAEPGSGICLDCGTIVETGLQLMALDPATIERLQEKRKKIITAVVAAVLAIAAIVALAVMKK